MNHPTQAREPSRLGLMILAVGALTVIGCGGDDDSPTDAGPLQDAIVADAPFVDAGSPDAGVVDTCGVGVGCSPDRGCRVGQCIAEESFSIGGAGDPIMGLPGGDTMALNATDWRGGYCTVSVGAPDAPTACDLNDSESCGDCSSCVLAVAQNALVATCARDCVPSLTTNSCPGLGNSCILGENVCLPGCSSDELCRVQRRDTNNNGEIDPFDATANPMGDALVYDDSTNARCNTTTWRCEHDGADGATAGVPCDHDFQCEANGDCITAATWTDATGAAGYCTKFGCDTAGNECAGAGSVCQARRVGPPLCLTGCTVGAEAGTPTELGVMGGGVGCRPGHACVWNGAGAAGVENNGACVPGEYNAVATPNIGTPCTEDSECYSPFGAGVCLTGALWGPNNYCSLLDCGAPGMPADVCGADGQCLLLVDDVTVCLDNCADATECSPGYACVDFDGMPATPNVCLLLCVDDAECRAGETCNIAPGATSGQCQ